MPSRLPFFCQCFHLSSRIHILNFFDVQAKDILTRRALRICKLRLNLRFFFTGHGIVARLVASYAGYCRILK